MPSALPALVGRTEELRELARLLQLARDTGTTTALVTGPAGIGKTALVEKLLQDAGHGLALRARAVAWEKDQQRGVLAQLRPGIDGGCDTPTALAGLASSGATMLVVDDAHWCDVASLQVLVSTALHHPEARMLVLLVADEEAGDANTRDLLARAADHTIRVQPLDARSVSQLLERHGVVMHPLLPARLVRHTEGIPAHVVQLVRELPRGTWSEPDPVLPPTVDVRARVQESLDSISVAARALVTAVTILGPPALLEEAARMAGIAEPLAPLEEARRHRLLVPTERTGRIVVRLSGPLQAAAVLEGMGLQERAELHLRAARTVTDPVRQLQHEVVAASLPDADLGDRLDQLASGHSAGGAWSTAAELLVQASRMSTDPALREDRLLRGVDALVGAGDVPLATAYIAEIESLRETPMRNAVLGYLAIVRGRAAEAGTRLARAWELVNTEREPAVAAVVSQRFVLHSLGLCRGAELVSWAERAADLAGPDSGPALEAHAILGLGLLGAGRPAEAVAWYAELTQRVTEGAQAQRIQMGRGWLDLVLDQVEEAVAELESAVPTGFLRGSARISLWAGAWLARAQFVRGDWDAALCTVQEGVDLAGHSGMRLISPLLHWTAAQVHGLRGDWDLAEESLRDGDAGPGDYAVMRVPSRLARAHVAEARADYRGVLRALAPLIEDWADADISEPGLWPWPDVYANALVVEGRLAEADSFLDRHERLAAERGHHSAGARLGYPRGRLLGAQGRLGEAREVFETAIGVLDALPLPYDRARVHFAYGQTLRRAGKRREADAAMKVARELFAGLGASTYVLRCDRELKAGGVDATRGERAFDELTPQENAISGLVARGLSNREVAAELFLSTKTVQYHLTRVYAKLGIRSRVELAARLPQEIGTGDAVGTEPR